MKNIASLLTNQIGRTSVSIARSQKVVHNNVVQQLKQYDHSVMYDNGGRFGSVKDVIDVKPNGDYSDKKGYYDMHVMFLGLAGCIASYTDDNVKMVDKNCEKWISNCYNSWLWSSDCDKVDRCLERMYAGYDDIVSAMKDSIEESKNRSRAENIAHAEAIAREMERQGVSSTSGKEFIDKFEKACKDIARGIKAVGEVVIELVSLIRRIFEILSFGRK